MAATVSSLMKKYQLREDDVNKKVTDIHIDEISRSDCREWRSLPAQFKMKKIVADDIDRRQIAEHEKRSEFLFKWREQKGSRSTYKELIRAVLNVSGEDEAEGVCRLISPSTPTASGGNVKAGDGGFGETDGCWRYIAIIICFAASVFVAAYCGLNPNMQELARNVAGRSWSFFVGDVVNDHGKQEVTQPRNKGSGGKRIEENSSGVDETDGCIRQLEDDDANSLSNYFGEACRTQTEIETLCDFLTLKTATINELQRENKLNPRNIAKRYLDENPRACWANIVRVLCELSKNRIAMKVAEKYDLNINDCNELS